MNIDHINIKAPAELLERVRAFYCDVLGLEEGFRPRFSTAGHWLYGGGKPIVHLSLGAREPLGDAGGLDHVAFRFAEGSGIRARLDAAGVPYRGTTVAELDLEQLFFRDPAGNGIEVNYPAREAP